eukprot:gnl/MRDRNA2_/MRDRNA2_97904_c0_seq1.p1 gnl/MRDRNA2_/MRDRNA2_97904_c0~~gnl/MRDRNA2_/MRDRNA2_97904_c0_seq1.p1  ORF type:complete len:1128 (-),score=197.03 gnl/MRDRNA2_/MRDRNA2_97904_c0_seq1:74-3421(-)
MAPTTYVAGGGGGHRRLPGWENELPLKDLLGLGEASKPSGHSKKWHGASLIGDGAKPVKPVKSPQQDDAVPTNVIPSSPKGRSGPRTRSDDENWTGISTGVEQSLRLLEDELYKTVSKNADATDQSQESVDVFTSEVTHERFTGSLGSMRDALQHFDDIHNWAKVSKYDEKGCFWDVSAACKDGTGVDDAMELLEALSDSLTLEVERVDYQWTERSKGGVKALPVRVQSPLVTVWERPDGSTFCSKSQKDGNHSMRCDLLAGETRRMRFDFASARPFMKECLQNVPDKGEPMIASWRKAVQGIHRGEATLKQVWQLSLQTLSSQLSFRPDATTAASVVKQHINAVLAQYARLVTSMMQAIGPVFPSACNTLEVLFKGLCKLVDGVETGLQEELRLAEQELKKRSNELAQANSTINDLEDIVDELKELISRDPALSVQRTSQSRRDSSVSPAGRRESGMSTLSRSVGGRSPSYMLGEGSTPIGSHSPSPSMSMSMFGTGRISEATSNSSSMSLHPNRASVAQGRRTSRMTEMQTSNRLQPLNTRQSRASGLIAGNDEEQSPRISSGRLSQTVLGQMMRRRTRTGMSAMENRMERGTQTDREAPGSLLPDAGGPGMGSSMGFAAAAVMRMNKFRTNLGTSPETSSVNETLHHNRTWDGLIRICQDAKLPPIPQSEVFDLAGKMIGSLLKEHHAVTGIKKPFDALRTIRTQYLHTYGTVNAAARNLVNHVSACDKGDHVRKGQVLTRMLDYAPAAQCFSADTTDVYMYSLHYCQKCIREQVSLQQKRNNIPYERACKYLFCFLKAQSNSSMFGLHDTDNLWDSLEDAAFFPGQENFTENRRRAELFRCLLFDRIGTRSAKPFNFMIKGLDNGSGFVDCEVFSRMITRLGHYATKRTLLLLDRGGTGSVNLEEFRNLLTTGTPASGIWLQEDQFLDIILEAWQRYNLQVEEALLELFVLFDESGDGHLQIDEFSRLCQGVDPAIPEETVMMMFESAADFEGAAASSNEDGMSASLFVRVYRKYNLEGLEFECQPNTEVVDPSVMSELSTSTTGSSTANQQDPQGRRVSDHRDSRVPMENLNLLGRLRRLIFEQKKRQIAARAVAEDTFKEDIESIEVDV